MCVCACVFAGVYIHIYMYIYIHNISLSPKEISKRHSMESNARGAAIARNFSKNADFYDKHNAVQVKVAGALVEIAAERRARA